MQEKGLSRDKSGAVINEKVHELVAYKAARQKRRMQAQLNESIIERITIIEDKLNTIYDILVGLQRADS